MKSRTTSLTVLSILFGVLLTVGSASAQGVLLEEGQSGLFINGAFAHAENANSGGLLLGFSSRGRVDFGISAISSKVTETRGRTFDYEGTYTVTSTFWTTSFFLQENVVRYVNPGGANLIVTLNQSLSLLDDGIIPSGDSYKYAQLGASLTYKAAARSGTLLLLSGGYNRMFPLETGPDGTGAFAFDAALGFKFKGNILSVGPTLGIGDDVTTYGIAIGMQAIAGLEKREAW